MMGVESYHLYVHLLNDASTNFLSYDASSKNLEFPLTRNIHLQLLY